MLPSASLGDSSGPGVFEPCHGSGNNNNKYCIWEGILMNLYCNIAPDIAGQDKANPLAQILSAAMMLR